MMFGPLLIPTIGPCHLLTVLDVSNFCGIKADASTAEAALREDGRLKSVVESIRCKIELRSLI